MTDPNMPTDQLLMHFGEMNSAEIRVARSAIRFANAQHQTEIEALQQRITELEQERQWQPIETSPKDGTPVWLFEPHSMGGFQFPGCFGSDARWHNTLDLEVQHPTHWQPLPPPPTEDDQ